METVRAWIYITSYNICRIQHYMPLSTSYAAFNNALHTDADNIYRILQSLASLQSSSFQISPISRFFSFQFNWHKALQGDIITIIANCTLHNAHCNILLTLFNRNTALHSNCSALQQNFHILLTPWHAVASTKAKNEYVSFKGYFTSSTMLLS